MTHVAPEPQAAVVDQTTGSPGYGVPPVPEGYRAHLDGIRTVAVYLVVLFHADVSRLSKGFIGVDVFFVLSGYLVTQVLMRDLAVEGRVRFGRFYARRFRRLLPASALVLLATAVVFAWVVSPSELSNTLGSFQASFLYVANWYFIRESTDYFAGGRADSPVLHFWSLAVEEQFYVLWPLALGGLVTVLRRAGARMWTVARLVVGAAAVASLAWALVLSNSAPDRAYYGTDTRAYQLLAGALVAMTPSLLTRLRRLDRLAPAVAGLSVLGLLVTSTAIVPGRPVFRGAIACVLTVALIVSLERRGGLVGRMLSWKPMVELGRISYGTYLWHWPVIVILARLGDFSSIQKALVTIGVSSGLAALSAVVVEHPFRRSPRLDRAPRVVVVAGLATSLLLGLLVIRPVAEGSRDFTDRRGGESASGTVSVGDLGGLVLTPIPSDFDEGEIEKERYSIGVPCDPTTGEGCTIVDGEGSHVLLLGDSNATMLQGPLADIAESNGLTFTTAALNGCNWQYGYYYVSNPEARPGCEKLHERIYGSYLAEAEPDVVIAFNVLEARSRPGPFTGTEREELLRSTLRDSVDRILASGTRLVVIEPMPRGPTSPNPLNCLGMSRYQEQCRFLTSSEPYWVEEELRDLDAKYDRMWSVDLDTVVCPGKPVCDPYVDGLVARWDDAHLTRRFAATLADDLEAALEERGLLDR